MKKTLLDVLVCPVCLPGEIRLHETIKSASGNDILEGELACPECRRVYCINNGIASLDPNGAVSGNKYETAPVVSS